MRPDSNGARAEEKRNEQLKRLRSACPLVEVDAQFSRQPEGWTIKGLRGGDSIIVARAVSLVGAMAKFEAAYAKLSTAGAFKRLMSEGPR